MWSRVAFWLTLLMCFAVLAAAQQPSVKRGPAPRTSAASGPDMYVAYCASCHGKDGKGGGPAASALKTPPPDLTTLAQRNNGKFPSDHVYQIIRGDVNMPAHGNKEMPVWGPVFLAMSAAHPAQVQMRLTNLAKYLESLQQK